MKLKIILFFILLSVIDPVSSAVVINISTLQGTKWHYKDKDWEYDIEFLTNGALHTTHPNNRNPNDDSWVQEGDSIQFFFNNKFSTYTGKISDNQIAGTATNKNGVIWEWSANRIGSTNTQDTSSTTKQTEEPTNTQDTSSQVDCESVKQTQTVFTEVNKQANKMILSGNIGEKLYGGVLKMMYGAMPSGIEQGNPDCHPK